jgi:hypothetical protein
MTKSATIFLGNYIQYQPMTPNQRKLVKYTLFTLPV